MGGNELPHATNVHGTGRRNAYCHGGFTMDREYFKKKSQGLFDARCFQLRTDIGYPRYLQLKNFFTLRKTLEEDTSRDPANTRDGKTKRKTHMLDEFKYK